jgi:hypothetical protein
VHRLEPLAFNLGILVRDRADGVVALTGGVHHVRMRVDDDLVASISVSARLSSADRCSHASDGSGSSGMAASLVRLLCSRAN